MDSMALPSGEISHNLENPTSLPSRPEKPRTREMMENPNIFSWDTVIPNLLEEKRQGKTITITNGHFALFHPGHSVTLEEAREVGTSIRQDKNDENVVLLAIVNSDHQTRLKDPVKAAAQNAHERAMTVMDNRHSDYVAISQAPEGDSSLITDFERLVASGVVDQNLIYVKGGDYGTESNIPPEAEIVRKAGGRFLIVDRVGNFSTSSQVVNMMEALRVQNAASLSELAQT